MKTSNPYRCWLQTENFNVSIVSCSPIPDAPARLSDRRMPILLLVPPSGTCMHVCEFGL